MSWQLITAEKITISPAPCWGKLYFCEMIGKGVIIDEEELTMYGENEIMEKVVKIMSDYLK